MQGLAPDELLGHLPLERDPVGTVPCHDFHPPEAQAGGSIHLAKTVHREGRTPIWSKH